jgi:hypothetical protein
MQACTHAASVRTMGCTMGPAEEDPAASGGPGRRLEATLTRRHWQALRNPEGPGRVELGRPASLSGGGGFRSGS